MTLFRLHPPTPDRGLAGTGDARPVSLSASQTPRKALILTVSTNFRLNFGTGGRQPAGTGRSPCARPRTGALRTGVSWCAGWLRSWAWTLCHRRPTGANRWNPLILHGRIEASEVRVMAPDLHAGRSRPQQEARSIAGGVDSAPPHAAPGSARVQPARLATQRSPVGTSERRGASDSRISTVTGFTDSSGSR